MGKLLLVDRPKRQKKVAVVFGATGQDGSYLSELLLNMGYRVYGVCRRSSVNNTERLRDVLNNEQFVLVEGDIVDCSSVNEIVNGLQPDEIYNLAAQSHVGTSFKQPIYTSKVNYAGVLNILEAIRNFSLHSKFYQASTSEMFGNNYSRLNKKGNILVKIQDEKTAFSPMSPYAVAKTAAHNLVNNYRKAYNIFACCGILFNHESGRRGENFVTRKITKWIGEYVGRKDQEFPKLKLGNVDSMRDWGHAEDYVVAMYLMLQQKRPDDYVVATSKTYSVKEFLEKAFSCASLGNWQDYVIIDESLFRPSEVTCLCGDAHKARTELKWTPNYTFDDLVQVMVEHDINNAKEKR